MEEREKKDKVVGVIAGTSVDTQFGLSFLEERNIKGIGAPVSLTPQEQTKLQVLNKEALTKLVSDKVCELRRKGADSIMIYCNSLSGAVDLELLQLNSPIPVISPLEAYKYLSCQFKTFGVVAANCQSTATIENIILGSNSKAKVIGIGNLQIVEDIEKGILPEVVVKSHSLPQIVEAMGRSGIEVLILGCTHFDYIAEFLSKELKGSNIFLPSEYMLSQLLKTTI